MSPVTIAVALTALALLIGATFLWRRALLFALPFLAALNGVPLSIRGSQMRVDQLAACLLCVTLLAAVIHGRRTLRTDATTWWLAAILAMNAISSVLNSPTLGYSLAQCVNLASAWSLYVLVINFIESPRELALFLRRELQAASIACVVAILAFVLAVVGLNLGGAEVSASAATRLTAAYGAFGTLEEPNILGSFAAAHLVLAVALMTARHDPEMELPSPLLLRWVAGTAGMALLLSFTRAAWLGAVFGILFAAMLRPSTTERVARRTRMVLPAVAVVIVAVALVFSPGDTGALLRFKLSNLVNLESQTAVVRALVYGLAIDQVTTHPIVGWGTFTFAPLVAQGVDFQQFTNWKNLWIGNYLLLALHDTGVIGLALWCGMLWSIIARALRAIRALRTPAPGASDVTLALTTAVVTMLIPFLATNGFSLGFPWLLIGLLGVSARRAATESASAPAAAPLVPQPADAT